MSVHKKRNKSKKMEGILSYACHHIWLHFVTYNAEPKSNELENIIHACCCGDHVSYYFFIFSRRNGLLNLLKKIFLTK